MGLATCSSSTTCTPTLELTHNASGMHGTAQIIATAVLVARWRRTRAGVEVADVLSPPLLPLNRFYLKAMAWLTCCWGRDAAE